MKSLPNTHPHDYEAAEELIKWNLRMRNSNLRTYNDLAELYNYETLREVFPWARSFRAGMVVLHRADGNFKMLLVHEKPPRKNDPVRKGPPKGSAEFGDQSALHTAQRELREETGIDIADPRLCAQICASAFIHRRPKFNIRELMIFIIVILDVKPTIKLCPLELNGYEWVDVRESLRMVGSTSGPTTTLMYALEDIDFWAPMKVVTPYLTI